jgi:hypothetical protein
MTVTFDKLGNELLDARHRHADHPLLFPLLELYCLVERTLERQLEIECNRRRLSLGTLGIAALARLELVFPRGSTRADLVILGRRGRYRDGPTFAAPLSIVLRRLGVVGGRGEGAELCHAPPPLSAHAPVRGPRRTP